MDEPFSGSLDDLFRPVTPAEAAGGRKVPFKFLDPYGPEDRGIYFGREYEVSEIYSRLYKSRILVVYGESGSGKTSLVQCGLRSEIPTEDAAFLTVRFAADPTLALGRELAKYTGSGENAPESLTEMLREAVFQKGKPLVLLFDQFEEFFLFQPPSVREAFVRELASWVEADLNIRVVLVIRQEFLAHLTELESVLPDLLQNRIWVRRISREQAREVILGPCRVCGVTVEEGLAETLLDDLTRSGGGVELPILQVVMDSLYRRAAGTDPENPALTLAGYQGMGKVESILARFVEETVNAHPRPDRVRQVLKALITPEGTKRISSSEQICDNAAPFGEPIEPEELAPILRSLIDRRVLREDADNRLYELRHDALAATIRQWMTGLEQELMEVRQTLENRFKEYQHRGTLLDAAALDYVAPYESRLRLNPDMRFFVEISRKAVVRKRRIVLTLMGTAAGVFMLVVSALGLVSYKKYLDSERNMGYVFTERARQSYEAQDYNAARLYSLYALSKFKGKDTADDRAEPAGYFTLSPEFPVVFDMPRQSPIKGLLYGLDFSPDGATVALNGQYDNTVTLWDTRTGKLKMTLVGGGERVRRPRFSPDGKLLAFCSNDRTVRVWDVGTGKLFRHIKNLDSIPWDESFSSDGRHLAFGQFNGIIRIWDLQEDRETVSWRGHDVTVAKVAFQPHGSLLASCGYDGSIRFWEAESGKEAGRLAGHSKTVWSICFSPDGNLLASCSSDSTIRIWDVASKNQLKVLRKHMDTVWDVDFSPDGKTLLSAVGDRTDHTVRVWNTATWKETAVLNGGMLGVGRVRFSPDGSLAASGGDLHFWDMRAVAPWKTASGHSDSIGSIAFSPDGTSLVTGSRDRTLRFWDMRTGLQTRMWENPLSPVTNVCVFPDGSLIAIGAENGAVQVRDAGSGQTIRTLSGHSGQVRSLCLSPGREFLASASADSTVRIWNLQTGGSRVLRGHTGGVNGVCFTRDGRLLASCSDDGTIRMWDVRSGQQKGSISGNTAKVLSIFSSPDGASLVSVCADNTVSVWDAATLKRSATFREDRGAPQSAALSPDGGLLAIGLDSGGVSLWNMRLQERIAFLPTGSNATTALGFSPDSRLLAAGTEDGGVRVWDVSPNLKVTAIREGAIISNPAAYFSDNAATLLVYNITSTEYSLHDVRTGSRSTPFRLKEDLVGVKFSFDTARLVTTSLTGSLRVWDVRTGEEIFSLRGRTWVDPGDFSPDGHFVAHTDTDRVARVWDVDAKRPLYNLPELCGVVFSPENSRVASVGTDGWVRILDLQNGRQEKVFQIPVNPPFWNLFPWGEVQNISPDLSTIAVIDSAQTIHVWELWTGSKKAVISPGISRVRFLLLPRDGARILVGGAEGSVQVFDVKTGKPLNAFRAPAFDASSWIALSPDGSWAAATGKDQIIRVWNVDTGKMAVCLKGHTNLISGYSVTFSPDGSRLATGDDNGVFLLWDMETVTHLATTPIQNLIEQAEKGSRLTMRRFALESDVSGSTLFGTPPRQPVWPERHPFHWLDRAEKGDAEAMLKLGAIYQRSWETEKAVQWYQKAAQAGSAEGKRKLEALQVRER